MKAMVLREFGGPDVLRMEEVPTPEPGPRDVLVQVKTVSVNRTLDLIVREGRYARPVPLPAILGVDAAGVVAAVGSGVTSVEAGQRVAVASSIRCRQCPYCLAGEDEDCVRTLQIGLDRWGGYAEYVLAPEANVFAFPAHLSFAEATVITRHFPTAFSLLDKAELRAGEWVLVMGAAGALGSCGVQAAKLMGARVIAAAGADERVAAAMALGADEGVNYRTQDLTQEVLRITDSRGVDVVFENISDPVLWPKAFRSLAFRGRLVTAGAHGGGKVELDARQLYLRRQRVIGAAGAGGRYMRRALDAAEAGQIKATIGKTMPLWEAADAHRLVERNGVIGKVILEP